MGSRTITQIILIVIAITVVFTYVKPKLSEIGTLQDEIARYSEAVDKAGQFNELLAELRTRIDAFTQSDIIALERYLPMKVDTVAVARDVTEIADSSRVELQAISFEDIEEVARDTVDIAATEFDEFGELLEENSLTASAEGAVQTAAFEVTVVGSYRSIKEFVARTEANAYPMQIVSFQMAAVAPGDEYTAEIGLETYALNTQN